MSESEKKISRVEKKKTLTRQLIVKTTIELFDSIGIAETTMERIAKEADIAKGTLYNYYACKEEILSDYINQTFGERDNDLVQEIKSIEGTANRIYFLFEQWMKGVKERRDFYEKYLLYQMKQMVRFEKEQIFTDELETPILTIIKLGQAEEELRLDLSAKLMKKLILFAFIELVNEFFFATETFNYDKSAQRYIRLILEGLVAR